MINNKVFEHRSIKELFAIVKNDFRKFDEEGLIDEGTLIKIIQYCNDKLGISIREVREIGIPVNEFKAKLPVDFEKLYYVCALNVSNTNVIMGANPFDNNFDQDIIYEAGLDRESLGCVDNYMVKIQKTTEMTIHNYGTWTQLDVANGSQGYCHIDSPNKKKRGKYEIDIKEDHIETPFRSGTLYLMYIGMMKDVEGNITFPFHPMIAPYYEWSLKEKVLQDAIFNSDQPNIGEMYKLAQQEGVKAWIEAFNITMERGYGDYVKAQRKRELAWYHQHFKHFQ